jgi:hypothetical protein
MFPLAGHAAPRTDPTSLRLNAGIQEVLDGFTGPAFAYDTPFNVVAFNRGADFIYRFDDFAGPRAQNMICRNFMNPYRRQLYVPWLEMAEFAVG